MFKKKKLHQKKCYKNVEKNRKIYVKNQKVVKP